jgi:hypothetical protein
MKVTRKRHLLSKWSKKLKVIVWEKREEKQKIFFHNKLFKMQMLRLFNNNLQQIILKRNVEPGVVIITS